VDEDRLPLTYAQYGEGTELLNLLQERVILPYSRSFSRLVGSRFTARDFISGETKIEFQKEFEARLRQVCSEQGIVVLQALVRDIIPPDEIKIPINEREIAKQQIRSLEQQIQVARSQSQLARQMELANQNQNIGDANKQVVTIVNKAEEQRGVALTRAQQDLAVARLRLEAAQKQAEATVALGQAQANVILMQKQAEAEPLRREVAAFGDGESYAQYFFYLKLAPSIRSILSNTEGTFAEVFNQFNPHRLAPASAAETITGVQP
jgi:regulator of protease activity HflC (stomatin/prohibitin superfamily)